MSTSRYTDKTYIGAGGMASVYKAFDEVLQRHVAVKEMVEQKRGNESVRNLFLDEARKMALIKHQNVVQVYDVIDDEEVPTIIMEYIEGGNLSTQLGTGALAPEEALKILEQVVSGLSAIHDAGFVHRDVKPENILQDQGVYKITDFGVAMRADDDTLPFVTNKYAAPEVLIDPGKINASSDLYSVGIMAIEMLLGPRRFEEVVKEAIEGDQGLQLPAIQDSAQAFWQQWVGGSAELPNLNEIDHSISPDLAAFLASLITRDQDARPQDCETVLRELRDVRRLEGQRAAGMTAVNPKLMKKVQKAKANREAATEKNVEESVTKKKKPLWFRLVVGIGILLLLAIGFLFMSPSTPRFKLQVVTDPPGAAIIVNDQLLEDYATPVAFNGATWGDKIVVRIEGEEPIEVVLADGMAGMSATDEGYVLEIDWNQPAPAIEPEPEPKPEPPLSITSSAEAAAILAERLPGEWPLSVELAGVAAGENGYVVEVGTPLNFSVQSGQSGALTMLHLGADNSLTRIYPSPAGAVLQISAGETIEVGNRLNLVAREPLGHEWVVFLVTADDQLPPEIPGSLPVSDWAINYPFGGEESPGRDMVLWLLDTVEGGSVSGILVELEVVAAEP